MNRQPLTVVVAVYNVEGKIARFLDALTWADEVICVDSYSTDRTEEVCRKYPNVKFCIGPAVNLASGFPRAFFINPNINFGIDQAKGDWILRLDSDEIVSPEMAQEIQNDILANPDNLYSGFWAPNRVFFFGKWLRYGVAYDARFAKDRPGFGFRKVLFRRGTARYACKYNHEDLTTQGEYGVLHGHYDHFSHRSVSEWIAKMNSYTDSDVSRIDVLALDFRPPHPGRTIIALVKIFFDFHVRRKGYRDGLYGFIASALNTMYILVERCKVWEKHYRMTHPDEIVNY